MSAAEIPAELPPVDQVKLVLMVGIENRLRVLHGNGPTRGIWARAAAGLDMDEGRLSRLRSRQYTRFSIEELVRLSDRVGVRLTIIAE